MRKIFLATKNKGKIKEMTDFLSKLKDVEILSILDGINFPDVEEDGTTFEENSKKKALEIAKHLKMYVIADDSGISAEGLDGRPGVYSARYAGENATDDDNNKKLIEELKNKSNKNAKYVAVITIASPDLKYKSFRGEVHGKIIDTPKGINGFGYDPYFYREDYQLTFGELDKDIKNSISHRGKALEELKNHIEEFLK